ncbi:MAG TPA: hypothetical protein DCM87_16290 [Planctomycetes bacterium]|nr:hypothetical protein [Planctomycetota bacterium]
MLSMLDAAGVVPATRAAEAAEPGAFVRVRIVVTQLPAGTEAEKRGPRSGGMLSADWGCGARLAVVEGDSVVKVLAPELESAADPDVSLDGGKVLFAGRKRAGDRWALYEINADGTELRQVFACEDDVRQPVYLPTVYTIIADPTKGTEPREHIGFVRFFAGSRGEHGDAPASALFSVKLDGTRPHRLTYSVSNDMTPAVLPDGRVLYASWQRATLDHGPEGRISLLGINADGLDPAIFSAGEGLRIKTMPCALRSPDRLVAFVEARTVGWDGAGALAAVSLRRNLHSYRRLTADGDGLFLSPSALPDGTLLAARRPAEGAGTHAIVRVDPATTGAIEPWFDDPAYHDLQPRALAPRPRPDGRSTAAVRDPDEERALGRAGAPEEGLEDGKLYALDVYCNDLGRECPRGTIARVRVIEGLVQRAGAPPAVLAPRRLVGEAAVETDGSFQVRVPARVPLQLQILDKDGLALRTSGWLWCHYKGQQGCVGCHEDGELTPPGRFVDALGKPAASLLLPPERRRTVDFARDIAPIVASRCAACHGGGAKVGLAGPEAFETLCGFLDPGRARTSRVVWHLFGRNTARPWDGAAARQPAVPLPEGAALTADERRMFVEWIDLGAPLDAAGGAYAAGGAGDSTSKRGAQ